MTEDEMVEWHHQLDGHEFEQTLEDIKGHLLCGRNYGKPRQHIKKQGHHFADKGPYSQSYGFSSSHVWM